MIGSFARGRAALLVLAALAVVAPAAPAVADAAAPAAHAAATCDVSKDGRKLGATYVTSLKVAGVSCAKGKRVVQHFNACRHRHGAGGRCSAPVDGFRCAERRDGIATQYDARVTCKASSRSVVFRYTQFL